jgi:xanthine dehydrogenase small subunit
MVEFILNDAFVKADVPKGMLLIDFIRDIKLLKGTKSACREGDCGSCSVLEGSISGQTIKYRAVASCITPMGNVQGKHIVTIEGLSGTKISPVQQSLVDAAAIQCGYCTPGIVVSLTAYALSQQQIDFESAKDAVAGNICRCTGYKSVERALQTIVESLKDVENENKWQFLIDHAFVPPYFSVIPEKLIKIQNNQVRRNSGKIVGGGTDLFVQNRELMYAEELDFILDDETLKQIQYSGNNCSIGAACKISDLLESGILLERIPGLSKYLSLIGSKLIRNMATVGGNLANASPIGDLSILFLALDATILISSKDRSKERQIKLKDFFKAYKKIDLLENEYIKSINFELPEKLTGFNFEKVSKRKYLDIASVNSAIKINVENNTIRQIHLSLGGVAPIPLYLEKTCDFLTEKELTTKLINQSVEVLISEIHPIDDVRGSAVYKSLLAKQLFFAHFIELFPEKMTKLIQGEPE